MRSLRKGHDLQAGVYISIYIYTRQVERKIRRLSPGRLYPLAMCMCMCVCVLYTGIPGIIRKISFICIYTVAEGYLYIHAYRGYVVLLLTNGSNLTPPWWPTVYIETLHALMPRGMLSLMFMPGIFCGVPVHTEMCIIIVASGENIVYALLGLFEFFQSIARCDPSNFILKSIWITTYYRTHRIIYTRSTDE